MVIPKNSNDLKQSGANIGNDQVRKACSQETYVKRHELRMPILHQTFIRLQAREAKLSEFSKIRREEPELQTQLLTLQLENDPLNDLLNQMRSASDSMETL